MSQKYSVQLGEAQANTMITKTEAMKMQAGINGLINGNLMKMKPYNLILQIGYRNAFPSPTIQLRTEGLQN